MSEIAFIKQRINLRDDQIKNTISLLNQGCTIPFISRYRKDQTANLDEVQIDKIANAVQLYQTIEQRKVVILKAIDKQSALTESLQELINNCNDLNELEDYYLPFKRKKTTKASKAIAQGLEPLAKIMMAQNHTAIENCAKRYVSKEVPTLELALQGARHIISAWVNENSSIRSFVRGFYKKHAVLQAKEVRLEEDVVQAERLKFKHYFDWSEPLTKVASHRYLAISRAEKLGYLKIALIVDFDYLTQRVLTRLRKQGSTTQSHIEVAVIDSLKRLMIPSISNEILQLKKLEADKKAIQIFSDNLRQLLLAPPVGELRVLAIDPGFKTGCKVVCLDQKGDLLHNETIYPHAPKNDKKGASKKIRTLVSMYQIQAIAIGDGTASRETELFVKKIAFDKPVKLFVVSEAGASVYSASKIAREEFPSYDVTVRGAVSIGRRLQDPLSELVKIDPKSIGVGQYQHDVDQSLLKKALDQVVENCVNTIGVNLNTASHYLLSYLSGISSKLALKIVAYRKENNGFSSRMDLKQVPGLGAKTFEQAIAFTRVKNADDPLEDSAIHPESFDFINTVLNKNKVSLKQCISNKKLIDRINWDIHQDQRFGSFAIEDIKKELEKPGRDPRSVAKLLEFDPKVKTINDLRVGQILNGIISNITAFGCFVNFGIKENGLIHVSNLNKGFVTEVSEIVKLHQHVQVQVETIDLERKRIGLSLVS